MVTALISFGWCEMAFTARLVFDEEHQFAHSVLAGFHAQCINYRLRLGLKHDPGEIRVLTHDQVHEPLQAFFTSVASKAWPDD